MAVVRRNTALTKLSNGMHNTASSPFTCNAPQWVRRASSSRHGRPRSHGIHSIACSPLTYNAHPWLRKALSASHGLPRINSFGNGNRTAFSCATRRHVPTLLEHCRFHLGATRGLPPAVHLLRTRPGRFITLEWPYFRVLASSQNRIKASVKAGIMQNTHSADGQHAFLSSLFGAQIYCTFAYTVHSLSSSRAHSYHLRTKADLTRRASTSRWQMRPNLLQKYGLLVEKACLSDCTPTCLRGAFICALSCLALPLDSGLNITQDFLCREALQDPIAFWKRQPTGIHWFSRYKSVFDQTRAPFYRWFPGGMLNACYEAVDTHVINGKGRKCAIVYDSPMTGVKQKISYDELFERVRAFAAALVRRGVERGDRVLIYMPLVPEAAVAMLACARIGAIHVVTFGGFGRAELALRIDHAKPKAVVAASCGIEPRRVVPYKPGLEQALQHAQHKPAFKVLLQRPQHICEKLGPGDIDWDTFVHEGTTERRMQAEDNNHWAGATAGVAISNFNEKTSAAAAARAAFSARVERDAVPVESDHPLYILYTSGTTGNPKGVVRDHVGQCVSSLYAGSAVYDISTEDTVFCASDLGWVLGHSVMLYGTLINGATTVLYEGKPTMTPDAGAFWRLVSEYGVSKLYTAPSAIRALRTEDPTGSLLKDKNLETLKVVYLVGEKTDRATMRWLSEVLQKADKVAKSPHVTYPLLVDHWWQTETGWPVTCIMTGYPLKPENFLHRREGSCGKPCPGWDVRILDNKGEEVEANVSGHIVLKLPLPPGALTTLYNDDERYVTTYLSRFPGFYDTGDCGFFDEDGYLYIEGRTDDVVNVAAHRLSGLAIEEVLLRHPAVASAAVVAVTDSVKGQVPVGVIVPRGAGVAHGTHNEGKGYTTEKSFSLSKWDISAEETLNAHTGNSTKTVRAGRDKEPQRSGLGETYRRHSLTTTERQLVTELVKDVRENIGPFACFKSCVVVSSLPHTRSGKVLRKTIALILEGREYVVPATVEDPSALMELETAVKEQLGITKSDGDLPVWANGLPTA